MTWKTSALALSLLTTVTITSAQTTTVPVKLVPTPDLLWGQLFVDVQTNRVFPDNKTFVDCTPKFSPATIMAKYQQQKAAANFDLKSFVEENFNMPPVVGANVTQGLPIREHLIQLWDALTRKADKPQPYSSLLPLPESYIVPGGRFREIYYWDSYFTMQGLAVTNRYDLIQDMVDNFKYIINTYGHIPNGNRNYYLSRSQPPFFALMVELLVEKNGPAVYARYLPAMEKEYRYWMEGENNLKTGQAYKHIVRMPGGEILNRYRDAKNAPREESYVQDLTTGKEYKNGDGMAYVNLRSSAESGMDFCSRWFADTMHLNTIETTDIVPVDLNSLLYAYETILTRATKAGGQSQKSAYYASRAQKRKAAIQKYFWSPELHYFFDYNFKQKHLTNIWVISSAMPLFANAATEEQARQAQVQMERVFLKDGGFVTSAYHTGEQWDAPNGWAPLQWVAIKGLLNYHFDDLARKASQRWMAVNERVYQSTGKMLEKYNVENIHLDSGGGEYPTQDGFGWTNGIYLKLYDLFGNR